MWDSFSMALLVRRDVAGLVRSSHSLLTVTFHPQTYSLLFSFLCYGKISLSLSLSSLVSLCEWKRIGLDRIQTKFSVQDFLTLFLELSIFHYILGFASVFVGENLKNSAEGKSKRWKKQKNKKQNGFRRLKSDRTLNSIPYSIWPCRFSSLYSVSVSQCVTLVF